MNSRGKRQWQGNAGGANKRPHANPGPVEDELIADAEAASAEADAFGEDEPDFRQEEELDFELDIGEAGRNWERPPPPALRPSRDPIILQSLEIDYVIATPNKQVHQTDLVEVPVIRMFGVSPEGNSVCVFVHGFEPYFYIEAPHNFGPDDCEQLRSLLNVCLAEVAKGRQTRHCTSVTMEQRQTIMHYHREKSRTFLRIAVATPNLVTKCRSILEQGLQLRWLDMHQAFATYESHVLFVLRFMIDCNVVGGGWVELPAGAYCLTPKESRSSHCQIEAHVLAAHIVTHAPEGEWVKLAPFRILSVDIECAGRKGCFPEPEKDPVIQIASMVTVQGQSTPAVRNVMTLDQCAPIVGAEVMSFRTEQQMLKRWRDLVIETDPDVIIGYNIQNFDLPYLIKRAEVLKLAEFPYWGRIQKQRLKIRDAQFSSKAYGTHDYKDITIDGRVQLDVMTAIQRDHKLSSYSLNAVSAHFLNEQKEDVHHSKITELQRGTDESRRRLAVYCLKDAYLPQRLVDKLMLMYNYIEMARVTGVPMSFLLTRGQSIKVFCMILRKARQRRLLIPNIKMSSGGQPADGVGYEGATVLEAKQGFYKTPVATLDFASLYPSIMMAHNICYSTLLPQARAKELPHEDVMKSPSGDLFVKAHASKGILPEILEELLGARKRAKADLKTATDKFLRAVLDGRQLALKRPEADRKAGGSMIVRVLLQLSANSVYGFTGATIGKMPCLEISSSVTAFGRQMIEHTKKMVTGKYNRANGYETDCDVIYGDTDSVMVNFRVEENARAMELGREAAEYVSATFIKPIKLEFEKVYSPYLLINKKRYAGLLWTSPDHWDKMDTKGIETVRRDNCLLVRNVVTTSLEMILMQKDVTGAQAYVRATIADLLMNRMDLSLLVITKGLTQDADAYKTKAAHVELAEKMRKRDPATAPTVGDRVPYVIVKAAKGAKAYEKAEDPIFALEHSIPIDSHHYLEHHLEKPLMRIFEPIMKNPRELLTGDHTRSITVMTPSLASGGIMKFAKVRLGCLSCKSPLPDGETTLCKHCRHKEGEIYMRSLAAVNALEGAFAQLWTQCQRCQGSLQQDVICTSRDCPIFYRRTKARKDLHEAHTTIARFPDW